MLSKLQSGGYSNELELQTDIRDLVTSAYEDDFQHSLQEDDADMTRSHDFHLVYKSDISNVFNWARDTQLISLSTDVTSLPEVSWKLLACSADHH